jgi:tetratricopeptide (TPR) repeat protein
MDKNRHLISRYLNGELDSATSAKFEESVKNDPKLRSDLDLYISVNDAISDTEVLDLRSQLNNIHEELQPEVRKSTLKQARRLVPYTAATLLLLITTYGAISLSNRTFNERFLGKFYAPYDMTMVNRSGNSEMNIMMHKALELYDRKEYREAVALFEKILEQDPSQMATRLYSGISFFEIKEYQKATKSFTTIIDHKDNLYVEQAEWFRGFCYVMMNEKEKAIRQFEKIQKDQGYYSEKAGEILKKLK